MSRTKIITGIILLVVVAIALWYFVFRKKTAQLGSPGANTAPVDADDEQAYATLFGYLTANIDPIALSGTAEAPTGWLAEIASQYYTGARIEGDTGRLVNGLMTKTGALLSAYATSYYGRNYQNNTGSDKALNDAAYGIFQEYKRKKQA